VKRKLAESALNQHHIEQAPVVIVVCADEKRASIVYSTRGRTLYCLQDTAYSLGLGTCWIGAFNEEETKEAINAPEGIKPVAMILVGVPDQKPRQRARKILSHITNNDSF
jgi:nitroreductase